MFLQFLTDFNRLFGEVHLVRKADEHSVFPATWVGLYFMGRPVHSVPAQPHKTKPCSQEYRTGTARKSSPQGVTIPNANITDKSHISNYYGMREILFKIYNI